MLGKVISEIESSVGTAKWIHGRNWRRCGRGLHTNASGRPAPTESFVVNGVRFECANAEWNKGFIHNGVEAGITYTGKDIIKVEVK